MNSDNNKPLISFILTYYALPMQMLCKCVESVLALSLKPSEREIILIDDGSNESPMSHLDPNIAQQIVYVRQQNQGLSVARNTGLRIASGRFIQFVDGDDYLIKKPYEYCIEIARNEETDMIVFDFLHHSDVSTSFAPPKVMSGVDYMSKSNIRGTAWGYLFKREILGDLKFTPGIYHEDEEFTPLLLLRAEKVFITDAKAYMYRQRSDSIISSSDEKKVLKKRSDFKNVILRLNSFADRIPVLERLALQRRVAQLTMDYVYNLIVQTRSFDAVSKQVEELRAKGLFPLPDHDYTAKYKWFRLMSSTTMGLRMLTYTLPLIRKER